MYTIIKRAAGIDEHYIRQRETVYDASIGTAFGWASKRETKRSEDGAYRLLGFFQVNMPLLYGEGTRAFYRLQLNYSNKQRTTLFSLGIHKTGTFLKPWVSWLPPRDSSKVKTCPLSRERLYIPK